LGYLHPGRSEGARVVMGGGKPAGDLYDRGYFVEPTVFDSVTPDMRIAQEEIFGPVLAVLSSDDEEEALAIANGTRYGLVASVWRITRHGGDAMAVVGDVSSEDDVVRYVGEVLERWGRIDILINNAALLGGRGVLEESLEFWNRAVAVAGAGTFLNTKHVAI